MVFVPKENIMDGKRIAFTKDEKYFVEDSTTFETSKHYIVHDNAGFRNYISQNGDYIKFFDIGE